MVFEADMSPPGGGESNSREQEKVNIKSADINPFSNESIAFFMEYNVKWIISGPLASNINTKII